MKISNLYRSTDILIFKQCYAMEKIHGSSSHLSWKEGQLYLFPGGEKLEKFTK